MAAKPMFAHMPPAARFACIGLILMSVIILTVLIVLAILLRDTSTPNFRPPNPTGRMILIALACFFFLLAVGGIAAAVLLSRGRPSGRVLALIVTPFLFLSNPIFLVLSIFVFISLFSEDMGRYLSGDRTTWDRPKINWEAYRRGGR